MVIILSLFCPDLVVASQQGNKEKPDQNLLEFVKTALRLRPKTTLQDIYKILYQAEFGTGHAVKDRAEAKARLLEEIRPFTQQEIDSAKEELSEEMTPGSPYLRVNLKPFLKKKCSLDLLAESFYRASLKKNGSAIHFKEKMNFVETAIKKKEILLTETGENDSMVADMVSRPEPSIMSHSRIYKEAYAPSYRIILKEDFTRICR